MQKQLAGWLLAFMTWPTMAAAQNLENVPPVPSPPPMPEPVKREYKEDTNYTRVFREGTQNMTSAQTYPADTLYLLFSHNYFVNTFPRGSNPAFVMHYTPIKRLQVDTLLAFRHKPVEFEGALKYQIWDEYEQDWLSLAPRLSFNTRDNVFGAELAAQKFLIPDIWQVGLQYNFISNATSDGYARPVNALGMSTIVRVWKHWHLFGDVVVPLDSEILNKQGVVWSAGLKKRIPWTPHILTFYVGNSQEQSLTGRTIAAGSALPDFLKIGFLFSIRIPELSQLPSKLF